MSSPQNLLKLTCEVLRFSWQLDIFMIEIKLVDG